MDIATIIGLISSLVTIEEAGRGWASGLFHFCKKERAKKKIVFVEWDAEDETTQRIIDAFKCGMAAKYKEHIFQPDEIDTIIEEFFKEKAYLVVDYNQRKDICDFIHRTFEKYNDYTRSQMTVGDRVLQDSIEGTTEKVVELERKVDSLEITSQETLQNTEKLLNSDKDNNIAAFHYAVKVSKDIKLDSIDNKINGEYSIDRNELISKIKREGHKFISIQGNAGCGKSALCKNLVSAEKLLLIARAEEFVRATHLHDVWNCDLNIVFNELSDERIVIYIDALEFIADHSDEKYIVLQELYNISSDYPNVFILTSCRTTDRNAFIKLHTKYAVETYEIDDITESELDEICNVYPVIRELRNQKTYSELLKNPFYINLVITNGITSLDISDENAFREYIWKNVICLGNKASKYNVDTSDICNIVNNSVFERAKKFLLGMREMNVQSSVLRPLVSEGIVTVSNGLVRLKYDVFEDICFEQYFDKAFDECRGNLELFYDEISSLGRCVYRRYQIWIANKLFIKNNRSKFIYKLLFSDHSDDRWRKQTEIGIVKSKYCNDFFKEYLSELRENCILQEFLDIINLYAFEVRLTNNGKEHDLALKPIGKARESMIQLVFAEKLFIDNAVKSDSVVKMCSDYAKNIITTRVDSSNSISDAVCRMQEYYLSVESDDKSQGWYYSSAKRMGRYLTILFMLAGSSKEWLKSFFELVGDRYLNGNREDRRWASDLASWIFENAYYPALTKNLGEDLCRLASCIYFKNEDDDEPFYSRAYDREYAYGLSNNASKTHLASQDTFKYFLICLFRTNFKVGLEWALKFTNRAFDNLAKNEPDSVMKIAIYFPEKKDIKEYYANGGMWICRAQEYQVPTIISDIVYFSKNVFIEYLDRFQNDQELFFRMGEWIQNEIYTKANNIAMLSVIQEIGFHFQKELPGYALELASSYELLHFDIQRHLLYHPNPTQVLLKKQIMQTVGVPDIEDRYILDRLCDCNLQEYVSKIQLFASDDIREKAIEIMDYLYSLIEDGFYSDDWKLQVQKMDLRNPSIKDLGGGYYEISPSIPDTVVPEFVVAEKEHTDALKTEINQVITQANDGLENLDYSKLDKLIDRVIDFIKKDDLIRIQYEDILVQLIVLSLINKNITEERRGYLCEVWASGIKELFNNGSFVADIKWVPVLFKQLDKELPLTSQNLIKSILLGSLIDDFNNGQIQKIANFTQQYLITNEKLAHIVFTAIIKLAEDEMNHQKFNAEYIKNRHDEDDFQFFPNMQKHLSGVDYYFAENEEESGFESQREVIIQKYLYEEEACDFTHFTLDDYDIRMLCHVANCGITLQDGLFYEVIKQIILCFIEIEYQADCDNSAFQITGTFSKYDVVHFFQREICADQESFDRVISLLFDGIDFDKFSRETIELYLDVFCSFVSRYFDAYQDNKSRELIEKKIKILETNILAINNPSVRIGLTQAVAMIDHKFYGDWSKCNTSYSEKDKRFLNQQYGKYGHHHFRSFLMTLYQMHIKELLPDILISVETVFSNCEKEKSWDYEKTICEHQSIVDKLILDAYVFHSDAIKKDEDLSNAYMHLLEMLIRLNSEKAAVLLDEFLIH